TQKIVPPTSDHIPLLLAETADGYARIHKEEFSDCIGGLVLPAHVGLTSSKYPQGHNRTRILAQCCFGSRDGFFEFPFREVGTRQSCPHEPFPWIARAEAFGTVE